MLTTSVLGILASAINRLLSLDPASYRSLTSLHNKRVQLELSNTGIAVCLLFTVDGICLMDSSPTLADITMRGSPGAIIKLCLLATPSLYRSDVTILGDMGLAAELQKIFQHLDLDWEGGLADYIGDVAAYHAGQLLRNGLTFTRRMQRNLCIDLKDYVQEEVHYLPARPEMSYLMTQVTRLRDDVERLAARINLLSLSTRCN